MVTTPEWTRLGKIKAGDRLQADDGFTCLNDGEIVTVQEDEDGLFVNCCSDEGEDYGKALTNDRSQKHYLDGQIDDEDKVVGFMLKTEVTP